jgi:hypothetical protein
MDIRSIGVSHVDETLEERPAQVPEDLVDAAERVDTLRFRKHADRNNFAIHGLAKTSIDVSRIAYTEIPRIQSCIDPLKPFVRLPERMNEIRDCASIIIWEVGKVRTCCGTVGL